MNFLYYTVKNNVHIEIKAHILPTLATKRQGELYLWCKHITIQNIWDSLNLILTETETSKSLSMEKG